MMRLILQRKYTAFCGHLYSMPVAIIADPGNAVAAGFDFGREKEKTPGCDDGTVLPGQCSGT